MLQRLSAAFPDSWQGVISSIMDFFNLRINYIDFDIMQKLVPPFTERMTTFYNIP